MVLKNLRVLKIGGEMTKQRATILEIVRSDKCHYTAEEIYERAKGRLMDLLHLSESDAHYRIQKKSMDSGRRIAEIAQEILDSEEIAC